MDGYGMNGPGYIKVDAKLFFVDILVIRLSSFDALNCISLRFSEFFLGTRFSLVNI